MRTKCIRASQVAVFQMFLGTINHHFDIFHVNHKLFRMLPIPHIHRDDAVDPMK